MVILAADTSNAQQLPRLVDGAHIQLSGNLVVERRVNRQFIMVKKKESYLAVFDTDESREVREIGIELDGRQSELRTLIGKKVSVSGKLQLEPSSPYYFNGVSPDADSVRPEGGPVLLPKAAMAKPPVPNDVKKYQAEVTFSVKNDAFVFKASSIDGSPLPSGPKYLSCGLNGPGDVMNCYCADGFKPVAMGKMAGKTFVKTEPVASDWSFAQFSLPDPANAPVTRAVMCVRK
jgi:hypothetical protein